MLSPLPWEKIFIVGGYFIGLVAELFGLYRMAHRHLDQERASNALSLWLSALTRGDEAVGSTRKIPVDGGEEQENLYTLQGLAFVGLGFILQAVVSLYSFVTGP